jgi:hypothetical protein
MQSIVECTPLVFQPGAINTQTDELEIINIILLKTLISLKWYKFLILNYLNI